MGDRNLIGIFEVNFCGLSEERAAGDAINLELDILGKYVERLLEGRVG